jgi:hypothetical protein
MFARKEPSTVGGCQCCFQTRNLDCLKFFELNVLIGKITAPPPRLGDSSQVSLGMVFWYHSPISFPSGVPFIKEIK